MKIRLRHTAAILLAAALSVPAARADDADDLRMLHDATIRLVNLLVEQGLVTREKADEIIQKAQVVPLQGQAQDDKGNKVAGTAAAAAAAKQPAAAGSADTSASASSGPEAIPEAEATESAGAAGTGASPTVNDLINVLVEQGVISRDKANSLVEEAQEKAEASAQPAPAAPAPGATAAPAGSAPSGTAAGAAAAPAGAAPAAAGTAAAPGGAAPAAAAAPAAEPKGTVHVQYVPEAVKKQIVDQVKQDVLAQAKKERWGDPGALPDWIYRIAWSGDFRLRGETDLFPTDGAPNVAPATADFYPPYDNINNTTKTSNRLRILARFGMEARISDMVTTGLRVATGGAGGSSNPGTENQTLGNYDTRFAIGLDRAYIRYKPFDWFSLTGGRLGNPFFVASDMVWAETLSLEGIETKFNHGFRDDLDGILIAGLFPIQQRDNEIISAPGVGTKDKWMFGYQTGLDWRFTRPDDLKVAVAFYDYRHVEGIAATDLNNITQYDWSAAGFRQKGNQAFDLHSLADTQTAGTVVPTYIGLVSKFRELNISTALDLGNFAPAHIIIRGDFVRNLGFHAQEIENRTGLTDSETLKAEVTGYQGKLIVGYDKPAERGQWQVYGGYRHLDRDAVLDAYNDQDFHLGGTNTKGYFVGGRYGLAKNTTVHLRWLSADQVSGLPLAIDVLQLDLATAF